MRRREFMVGLLVATAARHAQAQSPPKTYRIAIVSPSAPVAEMSENSDHPLLRAFFQELRRLGYVEGRNLVVERYSGEGHPERLSLLAAEIVRANPDAIVVSAGALLARSVKSATDTIPIVASLG